MKLTLVVLTILLGVAVSSPLTDKVDSLLDNLLATINKRQNGPSVTPGSGSGNGSPTEKPEVESDKDGNEEKPEGQGPKSGSGSGGSPPKSPEEEDSAEGNEIKHGLKKGMKKGIRELRKFGQFCKFNLTKEDRYKPVSLAEIGRVFVRINRVFTRLATKFKSHESILEKIEEMEEDDESTENHAELIKKFSEIPDEGLLKEVICALGSIKVVIARSKYVGVSKEDFPEVKNCHRTCGQLVSLLRVLKKKQLPSVNVTALKDNVEADYICMKSHVMGVKNLLDNGKKAYGASQQRPKSGDVFLMISVMEHVIEGLGIRGTQLHECSKILHKLSEGPQKPKPKPPGSDEIRSLLTELRSF